LDQQSETSDTSQETRKGFFTKRRKYRIIVGAITGIVVAVVTIIINSTISSRDSKGLDAFISTKNDNSKTIIQNNNKVGVTLNTSTSTQSKTDTLSVAKKTPLGKGSEKGSTDSSKRAKKSSILFDDQSQLPKNLSHKRANMRYNDSPMRKNSKVKDNNARKKKSISNEDKEKEYAELKGYSISEYPERDEPIISIDSIAVIYDDYPTNGAGVAFVTNCKNCAWTVSLHHYWSPSEYRMIAIDTLETHISKAKLKQLSVSYYSIFAHRLYNYYIFDKVGNMYGPFSIRTTPGKTIVFYIEKKL
jgi:hypothetical protein